MRSSAAGLADAGTDLSLAELADRCGLERPTTWRLLHTLHTNGLVQRPEPSRGYRLSLGWLGLAPRYAVDGLVRVAHPVLIDLATEHGVTASLVHVEALQLNLRRPGRRPRVHLPEMGRRCYPDASSPGKALLAALPNAEWRAWSVQRSKSLTDTTITSLDALGRELKTVRNQGYAICRGEDVTYSNGASAVIRIDNRPVAAIDLWGPDRRVPTKRLHNLGHAAVDGAELVGVSLS